MTAAQPAARPTSPEPDEYGVDELPLAGYGALMGAFTLVSVGVIGTLARRGGPPGNGRTSLPDMLLLAVASQRLSRLLTKDKVGSVVRAPFTYRPGRGRPGEVEDAARGRGLRRAVGELLTCPFCLEMWIAAGLTYGRALRPRETRMVASVFTTASLADWIQHAYVRFTAPRK